MKLLPLLLLMLGKGPDEQGISTVYGDPNDRYNRYNTFACEQYLSSHYGKKRWEQMVSLGVAHRKLPCGTELLLCRESACTKAYIVDRGPYWAVDKKGHGRTTFHLQSEERYRGFLDVLPPVAKQLRHQGKDWTYLWIVNK